MASTNKPKKDEDRLALNVFFWLLGIQTAVLGIVNFSSNIGQGVIYALFGVMMGYVFLECVVIVFSFFETAIIIWVIGIAHQISRLFKKDTHLPMT